LRLVHHFFSWRVFLDLPECDCGALHDPLFDSCFKGSPGPPLSVWVSRALLAKPLNLFRTDLHVPPPCFAALNVPSVSVSVLRCAHITNLIEYFPRPVT